MPSRYLDTTLRFAGGLTGFGLPAATGMSCAAAAFGLPVGNGWQSDPVDVRGQVSLELDAVALPGASQAMLFVGSTATGLGLLFVANAAGTGGNAITIAITAPSSMGYSAPSVVSNAITLNPGTGMSNAALAYRTNSDANAGALVQAYPWGIRFYGDTSVVPQDRPIDMAELDVVASGGLSTTNLAGGAGAPAQSGVLSLIGSGDGMNLALADPLATANVAGPGTYRLSVAAPPRFVVARFVPNAGSVGAMSGRMFARASA